MELVSIKNAPKEFKIELLKSLGYGVDEQKIYVTRDGKPVIDEYINQPVRLDNVAILPGSTIVIDDNPLSIASYLEDHGDVL